MAKQRTAVLGVGQTKYQSTRGDVSMAGLVREAALRALADAEMEWADVDAVVIGKAPDFFEGVMMPELYLADALGCVGKPVLRVHTAGSVGGSTALVAASLIQGGIHRRVLTLGFEKQSESNATWALSLPQPFSVSINAGTHVCLPRAEAAAIYDALSRHGVTHMCGAPIVLNMIANAPEADRKPLNRTIEIATAGAAAGSATQRPPHSRVSDKRR